MIKYKDTSKPAKPHHGAASGQNERKKSLKDKIEIAIGMTFLFCFLLSVTTCQPKDNDRLATVEPSVNDWPRTVKHTFNDRYYLAEQISIKNHLPNWAGVNDNNVTTKLTAAKPSRHSLAIFVPKIHRATNFMITTGAICSHIYSRPQFEDVTSYDGLIRPNTKPKGNKSSRLLTVVETRHPLPLVSVTFKTTKLTGGYHA